jgi:ribosomal protein S18 acetylase RimI-like enzyme
MAAMQREAVDAIAPRFRATIRAMTVIVLEDDPAGLADYAAVPIGFTVAEVFDDAAVAVLLRGDDARATPLAAPYVKDYDTHPDDHPLAWQRRFDLTRWTILAAWSGPQRVGGAVIIQDDPQIELLRDCPDCAQLWDIRVAPAWRARGVGSALLRAAQDVAVRRGARAMRVETQQVNVPASRFYARHGFRLERADPHAYHDAPGETQLLWRRSLAAIATDSRVERG